MKLPGFHLIVILLLAFGLAANGQEPAEAVLVDEFGKTSCEDIIARQDQLYYLLSQDPGAVGYAIIFADDEYGKDAASIEHTFHGQTEFRRFDESRLQVVRATASNGPFVQLWIVPPGASPPQYETRLRDFSVDPGRKPFIFNSSEYDEGPCPNGRQLRIYSETLKANPHAVGHIVIWAVDRSQYSAERERVERDFVSKHGVAGSRLRYFYFPHQHSYMKWEYWIVPGRIKQ